MIVKIVKLMVVNRSQPIEESLRTTAYKNDSLSESLSKLDPFKLIFAKMILSAHRSFSQMMFY